MYDGFKNVKIQVKKIGYSVKTIRIQYSVEIFTTFTRLPEKDSSCSVNVSKIILVVI